jgi:hypothetical protein
VNCKKHLTVALLTVSQHLREAAQTPENRRNVTDLQKGIEDLQAFRLRTKELDEERKARMAEVSPALSTKQFKKHEQYLNDWFQRGLELFNTHRQQYPSSATNMVEATALLRRVVDQNQKEVAVAFIQKLGLENEQAWPQGNPETVINLLGDLSPDEEVQLSQFKDPITECWIRRAIRLNGTECPPGIEYFDSQTFLKIEKILLKQSKPMTSK